MHELLQREILVTMILWNKLPKDLDKEFDQLGVACGCDASYGIACHFVFAKNLKNPKVIEETVPMNLTY